MSKRESRALNFVTSVILGASFGVGGLGVASHLASCAGGQVRADQLVDVVVDCTNVSDVPAILADVAGCMAETDKASCLANAANTRGIVTRDIVCALARITGDCPTATAARAFLSANRITVKGVGL